MKKLNISQVDTIFANGSYPIEFLIYYKNRLKSKNIRLALKKLSSDFWPMFGEYQAGVIQFNKYTEKEYFEETAIDQVFDLNETPEKIYDKYHQSIPSDLKKLFFLKIIQHRKGTVLIPKLNHLAGDGYSYFYFLSVLATLSRVKYLPFKKHIIGNLYKPHHKRTILKEFQLGQIDFEPLQMKEKLTIKFEEISKITIRNMIKDVASNFNQQVSTNDILSAMVVQKLVTIRKDSFGDDFQLTIPTDVRRQIKEYGAKFFGNGIMFTVINFRVREVEKLDIHELAIKIREVMPAISKEGFINFLVYLEAIISRRQFHKLKPFDPERGSLVTNLSKLPVNRLNFGTGEADLIFPLTIEENSAAILANKENFILRLAY
jgi:hypothetical protein